MHRVRETLRRGVLVTALSLGALGTLAFALDVGAEPPKTVVSGNVVLEVNGGISPNLHSTVIPSPVALFISAQVRTLDETPVPAMDRLVIGLDENGFIDTRGVPVCSVRALRENGKDACPNAVIGSGSINFEVARPPGATGGRVVPPIGNGLDILNGGMENGVLTLLALGTLRYPAATAITKIKIRRIDRGRLGSEAVITIPEIGEGDAAMTAFRLRIDKKVILKGKKKSVLTFRCVDGKARARVDASFADGTDLEASLTRSCLRKGAEPLAIAEDPSTELGLGVDVRPRRLPKGEPGPAELLLTSEIGRPDGTHPPALEELVVDLDRDVSIDLTGVPVCAPGPTLQVYPSPDPEKVCKDSIVGRGSAAIEIEFPERCCVVPVGSPLTIVSGGVRDGVAILYAHFEIAVPVPAAIVTTIKIKRIRDGSFGTRATFDVPKIAGGSGSLTSLRMRLLKHVRLKGEDRSLVTARCGNGKLRARADAAFADGTRSHSAATHTCVQRD